MECEMISVVMGVVEFDDFTSIAINSILTQTLTDIELIIVANGANAQRTADAIAGAYANESRIIVIKTKIGQLAHALNIGIDKARFEYIARMDSDDVAMPNRLKLQLEFLKANDLDIVGSDAKLIDEAGTCIGSRITPKGTSISSTLPFRGSFIHPTILMKKSIILRARGYNSGFNSEDNDLWLRLRRQGVRWDNMPNELLCYRIHPASTQRRLLGYAECAGYSLREFLLKKNIINFISILFHIVKTLTRPSKQ